MQVLWFFSISPLLLESKESCPNQDIAYPRRNDSHGFFLMAFQWDLGASNLKAISDQILLKMFPKYSLSEEQVRAFKVKEPFPCLASWRTLPGKNSPSEELSLVSDDFILFA